MPEAHRCDVGGVHATTHEREHRQPSGGQHGEPQTGNFLQANRRPPPPSRCRRYQSSPSSHNEQEADGKRAVLEVAVIPAGMDSDTLLHERASETDVEHAQVLSKG